jgi:acyl carrier protein
MESKIISKKIKEVMAAVFELEPSEVDDNCSSDTIAKWDSLKHINLITALEEEFDVTFSSKDILAMKSFKRIFSTLKDRIK